MENNEKPVFIIGNPRSGTTLLRLILTSHSKIIIPPESGFLIWWHEKYKNWKANDLQAKLDEFLLDLFSSKKFESWKLNKSKLKKYLIFRKPENYPALISHIYRFYGHIGNKKGTMWGDKNNYYLNHIAEINSLFPEAKFIHIVRDGRDIAVSYIELSKANLKAKYAPKLPNDVEVIVNEWVNNLTTINTSFDEIGWDRVLEVKYEDLVFETKKTVKDICKFLSIVYEPKMLKYYEKNRNEKLIPYGFKGWMGRTYKEIDTSAVKKYETKLTIDEKSKFEKIAFRTLKKYLYVD